MREQGVWEHEEGSVGTELKGRGCWRINSERGVGSMMEGEGRWEHG